MDNDLIDDTGVNILNIFFNKHLHEIKANINKGDKFPVWDGELLVYKSEKRNNKNIKGKISVQIKSTSKKDKLDFFSFDKTTLEKYMIDSGILILRPLANLDLLEPPIYYKFLFSTELKTIIRSNNFTIKFDKITDPKQFLNECYYFIEERPRQSNTENIISFEDIIRNDKNISFTMTTPFGMDLDSAIKTGKHNLYYKLLSKYELPINEKITKISPKVTSNIFVNEKQYFQDFIKEITYNENLRLKFNSVLTFELNNNKSIDLKLNINEASIVSDFVTALDFLYDTKEKGHFSIDKNIFNIQTLNLPSHLKNEHEYFKTLLTLFDILRIPYKNLSFNDIENIDINTLKNLIYFLILKGNVTANSQDQLLYQSFTILDREFIFLFEAINVSLQII